MALANSFLNQAQYGQDWVVATTENAINAAMIDYLRSMEQPTVQMAWVLDWDNDGDETIMEWDQLMIEFNNTDPFDVADLTTDTPEWDILYHNHPRYSFGAAFRAQAGIKLPDDATLEDATSIPDVVSLNTAATGVDYIIRCSDFELAWAADFSRGKKGMRRESQPLDDPWLFHTKVDISMDTIKNGSSFESLPQEMQDAIQNLDGRPYSIAQLLYNFQSPVLTSVPTINADLSPDIQGKLNAYFLGAYFETIEGQGVPMLGAAVIEDDGKAPEATFPLTGMKIGVNPFLGGDGAIDPDLSKLTTLNYLCVTGDRETQDVKNNRFEWNWLEKFQADEYSGVVAINGHTLANYFKDELLPYVQSNSLRPYADLRPDGLLGAELQWSLTPRNNPNVEIKTEKGSTPVVEFSYQDSEKDTMKRGIHTFKVELKPEYSMTLQFERNSIVATQTARIYLSLEGAYNVKESGWVVDRTIVDTYDIGVADGRLTATIHEGVPDDKGENLNFSGWDEFWGGQGLNDAVDEIRAYANEVTNTHLSNSPQDLANAIRAYVFPGGREFTFANAEFSDYKDLLAYITYAAPS
ncbi:uncharacterized protein F5Z01DRAFT_676599 [Emericellopsis atlantica]|uniref:Uncharacterized protein n=1 Tax=Emericellopsis atlantica TaxID=2614577 RepID=A0A9P7ZHB2_9HYPO|nr:uncharacterized protein F5Z01DRAFT_676599 [Emericellopsis atlantica]KAG9251706.1 hypothetical protein F5Z01DRAFT_676599 [Emericellopsis atlantica]